MEAAALLARRLSRGGTLLGVSASDRRRWDAVGMRSVEADGDLLRRTGLGDRVARCREAILAAVAAHGGREVWVFGSVARGEVLAQAVAL